MFRRNLWCFSLCPLPLVQALACWKEPNFILFVPSFQVFIDIGDIPWAFCSLERAVPVLSLHRKIAAHPSRLDGPPLDYRSVGQHWTQHSRGDLTNVELMGRIPSLFLLVMLCLMLTPFQTQTSFGQWSESEQKSFLEEEKIHWQYNEVVIWIWCSEIDYRNFYLEMPLFCT